MTETIPFPSMPENEDLQLLAAWDEAGYPLGPAESLEDYRRRLSEKFSAEKSLNQELEEKGEAVVFDELKVVEKERIPDDILAEAAEITDPLYGFAFRKFPGFFLSENVGFLWGGCMVSDTESPLAVFFIRNSFRKRKRFFIYRREELLAHELCHAARHSFSDVLLDEFFAYQTSPSRLRRYLGNCFIHQRDALFFTLPAMVLLAAQLLQYFFFMQMMIWPFWILALSYPAWLLFRNQKSRTEFFRAARRLREAGFPEPLKILFRTAPEERRAFARCKTAQDVLQLLEKYKLLLRWKVILFRFGYSLDNSVKSL